MKADGLESFVRRKTGLVIDAYFSGTKVRWLLDHVPGERSCRTRRTGIWNDRFLADLETDGRPMPRDGYNERIAHNVL